MAGGYLSPLPWLGLSSEPVTEQGGFVTPLPGWNAGGAPAIDQGGFTGLMAFWMGGAVPGEAGSVPVPGESYVFDLVRDLVQPVVTEIDKWHITQLKKKK